MSTEAVTWAMDEAPMLLTDKGKPDTTARHVLQVLAEHANRVGANAHPSVLRIQYRTGFDRRTVQRALRRLQAGRLITADGEVSGRTRWRLALDLKRPDSDWEALKAEEEAERAAAAERKRRSRAKAVTHSASVTVTHSECVTEDDVTHSECGRHVSGVRDVTHSASGRHALSAARTISEPSVEPPGNHSVAEVGENSSGSGGSDGRPDGPLAPIDVDGFTLTDGMRRWAHRDGYAALIDIDHSTAQFVRHYRGTGARRKSWPDTWQKWIRDDAKRASERTNRPTQGAALMTADGEAARRQPLPGTDTTVAGWGAVAASLDTEDTA